MKLRSATSELAARFQLEIVRGEAFVSGAQLSSNLCEPGDLFIAIAGLKQHGVDHLSDAIDRGAVAVLTDADHVPDNNIAVLVHPNPKSVAGELASYLYETSSSGIKVLGVTGTNGKTSTTTYLQQLLTACDKPCGLSASTNRIVGDRVISSALTTPEVTEVHKMLSQMHAAEQQYAALEVSAQAMIRHRVDAVKFELVGFTNLSRDHLDDFGDMDQYLEAKAKLFTAEFAKQAVILVEDDFAQKLLSMISIPVVTIGEGCDYQYQYTGERLLLTGKKSGEFAFLGGALMAKNLVLALVMLLESGIPVAELERATANTQLNVPGRLERVSPNEPAVFIDYAHTPAGVAAAVNELRAKYPHLTVVLGASGNRDQGKRGPMALAATSANLLVITDQHPRDEDPALIRKALVEAASSVMAQGAVIEVSDPTQAIAQAIAATPIGGAVLWCGPGHLTYREVAGTKVPFDARKIAAELVYND